MLKYSSRLVSSFSALLLCALLILLSACSSPFASASSNPQGSVDRGDGTPVVSSSAATTPTPQTVPMPHTETSCPAAGTARAAVIRPLALGNHQNLVYLYGDASGNRLRRYDMATGQKTDIFTTQAPLYYPEISSDGQWVFFIGSPGFQNGYLDKHPTMLQLVRMDGQGLQTLYCFSNIYADGGSAPSAALSPDMQSIAITYDSQENGGTVVVQILHLATGQLQTVFTAVGDQGFIRDLNWLDATHIYVTRTETINGNMITKLVLLDVAARTGFQPIRDFTPTGQMNGASYTCTPDGTKLFVATYQTSASSTLSAITAGSSTASASSAIYKLDANTWARQVHAFSNNSLLLLVYVATNSGTVSQQIWTMNADGAGQKVLATISSQPGSLYKYDNYASFNSVLGPTWFNVSRDGSFYALNSGSQSSSAILVGSLSGGKLQAIADTATQGTYVSSVGWTTM